MSKFEVGQRVRVYAYEMSYSAYRGTVVGFASEGPIIVKIDGSMGESRFFPQQLRKLRPKKKSWKWMWAPAHGTKQIYQGDDLYKSESEALKHSESTIGTVRIKVKLK